jgi:DNA-binding transcriptional ArsR family regulator
MASTGSKQDRTDRNLVLVLCGIVLLALMAFTHWGPQVRNNDPNPTTYNSGTQGAKAAYLLAGDLGYDAQRWTEPMDRLKQVDAARTTLVLTEPMLPVRSLAATKASIADFLARGGRMLATGATGAALLPNGKTAVATNFAKQYCFTRPEGAGELARVGRVEMAAPVRWDANGPEFRVEERCGTDAVVVRYPYGKGEAIWWASPTPLTNAGLKNDAGLAMTLASLGPVKENGTTRTILFDEYLHAERETLGDTLAGLPWWALKLQFAVIAFLLVVSFSRRNGPLRTPVAVPRTSPLEFADSMGRLYERAKATDAPVAAARAQTMRFLAEECGLSHDVLRQPPEVIAGALAARIGGDWSALERHLEAAARAGESAKTSKQALKLVQALEEDRKQLALQVSSARQTVGQ